MIDSSAILLGGQERCVQPFERAEIIPLLIADCQLPIAELSAMQSAIGNRQCSSELFDFRVEG